MIPSSISPVITLAAQEAQGPGGPGMWLPFLLLFVGMWFLIIAPQRKRQKQHDEMIRSLKSGDEIVTNGGMFGTITNVKDDRYVVRIADNTKIELAKHSVQAKINKEASQS